MPTSRTIVFNIKADEERKEKIKEYARTRERDSSGRFVSERQKTKQDVADFYSTPYKIIFEPARNGPNHILVRKIRLHWHQKFHMWFIIATIIAVFIWTV